MMLIGMFDSPFVRRVAISMKLLGLSFEHANWSVGKDFARIREYNPLGRVPTLVLDNDEALMESAVILDHLDELAGERALVPRSGSARRRALRLMAIATGAAEKGVAQVYERAFRPAEKIHQPWLDRCATQVDGGLRELDRECVACGADSWLMGREISQPDITLTCVATFLSDALGLDLGAYPGLQSFAQRCEALPEFKETRLAFFVPQAKK